MNDFDTHQGMDGQQITSYQPGRPSQAQESIPRVSVGNIQGVTRYTSGTGSQEQEQGFPAPGSLPGSSRSSGGVDQGVIFSGSRDAATIQRITSADLAPAQRGILGTLQNNAGFPTGNIGPNATVELPGLGRTSVKVAVTLGYLSRTEDGRYVEAGSTRGNVEGGQVSGSNAQDPQQQQAGADEAPDLFAPNLENAYGNLIADIPQGTYESMLASGAALIGKGGDLDSIAQAIATRSASVMGVEPSEAAEQIKLGAEAWQKQADGHLQGLGIDPSDFYEWAKENRPNEIRQALQGQLFGRSLKGYTDLANAYYDSVPPTLEALAKGGVPTRTEGGAVMVQLQGVWMSLDSAVKARLV
jgi:hypothetical protein